MSIIAMQPARSRHHWLLGLVLALALIGCGASGSTQSQQSSDFGPLAVVDSSGGSLASGGTGPIRIEGNCVTMTLPSGDTLLLIWLSREVRWDDDDKEILYSGSTGADAGPITIRDGDTITVGGESLQDDEPVTRNLVWLATPPATCSGEPWIVNSVVKR